MGIYMRVVSFDMIDSFLRRRAACCFHPIGLHRAKARGPDNPWCVFCLEPPHLGFVCLPAWHVTFLTSVARSTVNDTHTQGQPRTAAARKGLLVLLIYICTVSFGMIVSVLRRRTAFCFRPIGHHGCQSLRFRQSFVCSV